jgi:hypothetical protein
MKNLLIKIAYKILFHYGLETMPIFYFNGIRYCVENYEVHFEPNEKSTIIIKGKE